jgi:hypothetical protein
MVHLRGFGRPFVSKHLVCCCKPSSFFMVKSDSMDYPPDSPDLAVRHFYFWTSWKAPGWQTMYGWPGHDANSHLLTVDTRNRFLGPRDTSLGAVLAQTLKYQWWRRHELLYAICCSCAMYEYIEVRIKFSVSSFI